ncbi:hypothetical protein Q7C_1663 [Methylophaga frappieri]|uniref:Uncharacterized protein n=1 Tax=Methylophaga frappieri (strain ATCC BAA-2434 / DSM 25690 / JAM7) TaxID=754477 RepID=I1YIR8_METFJ|nr:hypothetical protein [Methylophaga frappieri]AFJ02811.1 hypothetical protein Q7C_1663 [Methylophaga frappieri]
MFNFRYILSSLLIGFAFSTSVQAAPSSQDLIGTWYNEREADGETMKWLMRRMDDNKYAALFLVCNGDDLSWVQKELGAWQIQDDKLIDTMHTLENMNGKQAAPENTQTVYIDLSLDGENLHYQKQNSDKQFDYKRVENGFQISCK